MMNALDRPAPFDVSSREETGVFVVAITGELDMATAPEVEPHAEAAVASGLPILCDLQEAEFIDSSGIRAIVNMKQRAQSRRRAFAVTCAPDTVVARVLEVASLYDFLTVDHDRDAALARLRSDR